MNDFKTVLRNVPQNRERARKASEYLSGGIIDVQEGHAIVLTFDGGEKVKLVSEYREMVEKYMRGKLKNQALTLEPKYIHVEKKKKIYTAHDKFQFLKEKHAKLNDLSVRFGLEVDL